jgi:hypothetical protein
VATVPLVPLWSHDEATIDAARITAFLDWLNRERGIDLHGYHEMWAWSVADLVGFWDAVRAFFNVRMVPPAEQVLVDPPMPGTSWFPRAKLNYAEHLLGVEAEGLLEVLVKRLLPGHPAATDRDAIDNADLLEVFAELRHGGSHGTSSAP